MFEGNKVRLRAYTRDDLPLAQEFLNDIDVISGMNPNIIFPIKEEDEVEWYESFGSTSQNTYSFVIETRTDQTYVGGCGINEINTKNRYAVIGLFIGKPYWRNGYGSDALNVLVDFCFNEVNMNKVKLYVFSFNEKAISCYEKAGFVKEGVMRQEIFRNGEYHDMIAMGLLKSEWES